MVRIRHSLEKLLAGKDSIDEIAFSCGMSAKAYSQAFKDLYGITQSVYRKQFQNQLYLVEYLDIDKEIQHSIYLFKNIDQLSLLQENNILTIKPKK